MNQLYQVSTLNALMLGNFDGADTIGHILSRGDYGIGTFEGMDGEMIVHRGVAYRANVFGDVSPAKKEELTPFCIVGRDDPAAPQFSAGSLHSFESLKLLLDEKIKALGNNQNCFYLMHGEGHFGEMQVRSIAKQQKPYQTLSQVAASQQEHSYHQIAGYLVGVWFPAYFQGINMPGWHLHFLSADLTHGGHILNLNAENFSFSLLPQKDFVLHLPSNPEFASLPLASDLSQETHSVEGESQRAKTAQ